MREAAYNVFVFALQWRILFFIDLTSDIYPILDLVIENSSSLNKVNQLVVDISNAMIEYYMKEHPDSDALFATSLNQTKNINPNPIIEIARIRKHKREQKHKMLLFPPVICFIFLLYIIRIFY